MICPKIELIVEMVYLDIFFSFRLVYDVVKNVSRNN